MPPGAEPLVRHGPKPGRLAWWEPAGVALLLAAFGLAHLVLRVWFSPVLTVDGSRELTFAQTLAWGYQPRQPPLYNWLVWGAVRLPRVVEHATEVRPDVPALAAWLGGLLALIRWREDGRPGWLWGAGILFGVGASFTPKIGYSAPGVLAVLVAGARARGPGALGRLAMDAGRLGAASALPPLLLLGGGSGSTAAGPPSTASPRTSWASPSASATSRRKGRSPTKAWASSPSPSPASS